MLKEEVYSWKEVRDKWIKILRLWAIISVIIILFKLLNPYTREEHIVLKVTGDMYYSYDVDNNDGTSAFFDTTQIKDEIVEGDRVQVYYSKKNENEIIKVKLKY